MEASVCDLNMFYNPTRLYFVVSPFPPSENIIHGGLLRDTPKEGT